MNCDSDSYNCPFLVDSYDPDQYICIKCGREHSFHRANFLHPAGLVILTIISITLLKQMPINSQNDRRTTQTNSRKTHHLITQAIYNQNPLLF